MESLSPQVVSAAKLPILNPNEFDLWKMRIEQVIEGVVQPVAPTTTEQRLARKNKLKAQGTLLIALPDKHQLKFNIHKDAKTLMEAIEKRFGGNKETKKKLISQLEILGESLSQEDVNFNLKIYEAKVKSSSSASPFTHNIAFVSSQNTDSTNESVSVVASVSAASAKVLVSALPNVDTLSDAEMDLKWQMAMLTMRARRFLQMIGRNLRANGTTSNGFDMLKVDCYNYHRRGHFARECSYDWSFQAEEEPTNYALMEPRSLGSSSFDNEVASCSKACTKAYTTLQSHDDKLTNDLRKSQFDVISYKTGLESVEARLLVYQQNETVFEEDIKLLNLDVELRDNALVALRKKFEKAKQERDDFESDVSMHASPVYDRYQLGEGYHVVPHLYTGTFMPPKSDLDFHDAPNVNETVHTAFNVELSPTKPDKYFPHSHRPSAPIIEDWDSDSKDESEDEPTQNALSFVHPPEHVKTPRLSIKPAEHPIPANNLRKNIPKSRGHSNNRTNKACFVSVLTRSKLVPFTAARPVTTVVLHNNVTRPRPAKTVVTKPLSPSRRTIKRISSPKPSNFPLKFTTIKASKGNPQHALKDKGVIDSGCSRHMTGNMSYISDFEAINGGYVAFGRNLKGGKIKDTECIVLSSDFKLPDENHVLLRVPRENNIYNIDLKNIVSNRVLVTKPHNKTSYELLLGRTPSIGFMRPFGCPVTILNTLDPLGKFDGKANEGFLVGYSVSSKAFRVFNSRTRIIQETLHIIFLENKPNVAGSGRTWLFDIDTLTKSLNYQPVTTGNQPNSRAGIQEHFNAEKAREENVQQYVLFPLWSFGFKDPQNTDDDATFEVKEPEFEVEKPESEVYVSPSSTLEDITYSNDEEDVGAEADFTNLETTLTVSPIPTTRVHKYLSVTQIISDLSLATQTRSMTRMVKDQDPSWIEAMQEELLQFKMQKEEGIDYEEVFAPVARIEAIRLFLAYASFMGFMVYKMDVKSAFLYGTIKEEVYVCQPLGFKDPNYPDKVYKVVKALYGLHQAPRAWYETLANYLLENGFQRGKIDQTLFIKKQKSEILLVQVYVDDIIFGSTNKDLCKAFEKLMKDKFQMSSMGELTFFWSTISTPIETEKPLLKDPDGEDVDVHTYRSMIGSLMYLTSSRPDIMFVVYACSRFQVTPKASHLHAVKRIFRYLKGKTHLGLWYPKDSPFNLVAYSDSDYAGASLDRMSTIEGCQFIGCRLISWQCKKQTVVATSSTEAEYVAAANASKGFDQILDFLNASSIQYALILNPNIYVSCIKQCWSYVSVKKTNDVVRLQALIDRKKVIITKDIVRQDLRLDDVESTDCLPNEEIFKELARMGYEKPSTKLTFYKAFFSAQWNLVRNVDSSSKFYMYPRFLQLIIHLKLLLIAADDVPAVDVEATPPSPTLLLHHHHHKNFLPHHRKIEAFKQDKMAQALEITKLKQRVRKLERKNKLKVSGLRRLKKVGTAQRIESFEVDVAKDAEVEKNADVQGRLEESQAKVYHIELEHAYKVLSMQDDEPEPAKLKEVIEVVTTAKLMIKVVTVVATPAASTITVAPSAARRRKEVVIRDPEETATPSTIVHSKLKAKDKGKGIMVKKPKPLKKQAQIEQDEAYARELEKSKEQLEEEESRALKRQSENSEEKAAKKQKLDEEAGELKKHLQIVPNDDDDVYTLKVPDLVQERFASSKPSNFLDDFLLTTLKVMFEKPDVEAQV
nr:hypothetical protein [Tanacetum cinerariifolium]